MSDKLPQSEGADWFLVLDEDGVVEIGYTADLGRSFGHEHINDAMQDSQLRHLAKNWVVRPAYSQSTVDLLRARIAELERALQGVLDPFHQGQISARPEAAGSVQAAIDAGEAALLKATKP